MLVGTSAGAAVAAQLGSASTLDALFGRQVGQASAEIDSGVDVDTITELFLAALAEPCEGENEPDHMRRRLRRIGGRDPRSPRRCAARSSRGLPSLDWPARPLRLTAIDVDTGELVVFDRDSGVDLVDAVAASCAVPGAWPPVAIGGRRYMDGGVGSSVNLGVAGDCDVAVVLVPSGVDAPAPFGDGPAAEIAAFGGSAFAVFADGASLTAFGANPLDPRCRIASATAGREQNRREAAAVARFLGV
ncbi:hypothetical protein MPRM_00010 [Mycobacterium parmense]|uniref:PNPLA domain-containing protein n=1 Tax=Mycobacterium parmense TaxID=185642 RepID=A0A7I7YLK6_9MYCO|nr:hypothetical protein MPRM_00010 [Mycobacterium parmense]